MGGEAKQFRRLESRPTLCWAALPLLESLAGPLVVVLPEDRLEEAERLLIAHLPEAREKIRAVPGGVRRRDSVRAALEAIEGVETVLVHDAVRPFASAALVTRVGARAAEGRAVVPALRVRDTLKEIDDGRVVRTLDRERLVAVQTPQGFPLQVLRSAHEADDGDATDDAALVERLGHPVTWVEGERMNRKLTDPEDWAWAEEAVAAGRVRWRQEVW
ncbi:MAG: 2-C-methyl-D-erythritol 4-phosphate cytidylyltransferase [Gemmatimonadetes bacterium]|nr:2-C-methyl-D-erythritol 4-phosphate cytidylyltransferase [Gemmatimonadota bacterium]